MTNTEKSIFKSKNEISRDELADLFQSLADRASEGTLTLTAAGDPVTFDFADGCLVEIEVIDKPIASGGFEREFELEISWRVDETGAPVEGQTPKRGFTVS